ncbi:MAG: DUF418 domain-containing protein [Planctomycetota bacterium]|jgi:uncharacterized protein
MTRDTLRDAEVLGPIRERDRIITLDVLRGFAVLGILFVNMPFFSMPLALATGVEGLADAPALEEMSWAIVETLVTYKFLSLFSLLFGAGLVMQMSRAEAKGRRFVPLYLRRLGVLAAFGLAHALLLWYGDILLRYAVLGLLPLLMRKARPRTLVTVAVVLVAGGAMLSYGCLSLQVVSERWAPAAPSGSGPPAAETTAAGEPAGAAARQEPPRGLAAIVAARGEPSDERWMAAEIEAYKYGPAADAFAFRSVTWAYVLLDAAFLRGLRIAAMFLLGAALMKQGFFLPQQRRGQRRLFIGGVVIGLPLELGAVGMLVANDHAVNFATATAAFMHELGSFALCLGYTGGVCLLAGAGRARWLCAPLASVGRLTLSVYLLQTVVAAAIMYWWGWGWFNDLTRPELIALVVAICIPLIALSGVWLRFFAIGPFEWMWRSLTYGRRQPLLKRTRPPPG